MLLSLKQYIHTLLKQLFVLDSFFPTRPLKIKLYLHLALSILPSASTQHIELYYEKTGMVQLNKC